MKTLYHGTNGDFSVIRLDKCTLFKDFGRGFYLTPSQRRARLRALDKCDKEHEGVPVVQTYQYDDSKESKLNILVFDRCDEAWLDFILHNRNRKNKQPHSYDIVVGPVADDGVITSINLYEAKVISKLELLKRIKAAKPYTQYTFCTQRAIDLLTRK